MMACKIRKIGLLFTLLLLQGAIISSCVGDQGQPEDEPAQSEIPTPARGEQDLEARVTVEIFSGQPNPEWTLSPEDSDELSQRMGFLMPAAETGPPPEGLGYRGIVVRVDATNAVGAASIRALGGTIYYTVEDFSTGEPSTTPLTDPGGTLEPWLLSTGEDFMDAETFGAVQSAIDQARVGAGDAGADTGADDSGEDAAGGQGESDADVDDDASTSAEPTALPPPTVTPSS